MLTKQDVENNTVNLVVLTEEVDHTNFWTGLAEAIDSPLTLIVSRWIPTEVVVKHGVEMVLKVDTLAQTIRANQNSLWMLIKF